jgi:hypothetical protein
MTVPAYRAVSRKYVGKLLGAQLSPLHCLVVWAEQRRGVIEMVEFAESLATVHALPALIPVRNDIPNEAVLGVHFNLLQAFLTATLTLGPT